jgi:chorismate dehydratase
VLESAAAPGAQKMRHTVGTVSYLNALPLVDGLDRDLEVLRRVPADLLTLLERGSVDIALCPVIDFQRARSPLAVVPVGAIGCRAETLTVRCFGRRPFSQCHTLWVDGDSHTSIALAQVLLERVHGVRPTIRTLDGLTGSVDHMLLIGDKVVVHEPDRDVFPHQMDLGHHWRQLTGLPFVFAVWMAPEGAELGGLPERLVDQLWENLASLEHRVPAWATAHGWPEDTARRYLGELLDYSVGEEQLDAMALFATECHRLGLIGEPRPLRLSGT